MKLVNVYEARGQFSKLIDEAVAGEEIVIARNGTPIVRRIPVRPPQRLLGGYRGQVPEVSDEVWSASESSSSSLATHALEPTASRSSGEPSI